MRANAAPATRLWIKAGVAAWIVFAVVVLSKFADEALPNSYLTRPLLFAAALGAGIGLTGFIVPRLAVPLAAAIALVVALANPLGLLLMAAAVITERLLRMRGARVPTAPKNATFILLSVLLAISLTRAIPQLDLSGRETEGAATTGPRVYVILLDGYPRLDTLAELGVDNGPFIQELSRRGFDYYPAAMSTYRYTHKTLLAMLTDLVVADGPSPASERQAIREHLFVPEGYVAISPPIGHVVLRGGPLIDVNVVNDFESHLLGQSALGRLAPEWFGSLLMDGLRENLHGALRQIEAASARRVFAHIMAPHPPFLYSSEGVAEAAPSCWPSICHIFDSTIENLEISLDAWANGMEGQISALNDEVLTSVDVILAREPQSVVVLFSDHGGRYTFEDLPEWHRSFLAARTPGRPELFAGASGPDDIFRVLEAAYGLSGD